MKKFKTKIEGFNDEFNFECYENTEPINIGDKFIFFFGDIADVQVCDSEKVRSEVNKHDRPYNEDKIDFVYNFWTKCYKIKNTNFDLNKIK